MSETVTAVPVFEERPRTLTEGMKRAVAERVAKECAEWAEDDADGWVEPLMRVIRRHGDGYALARDLERSCGVDPDARLVEILDGVQWEARSEIEAAEKAWAARVNPQPPLPIGARVTWRGLREESGTLCGIYTHGPGKYLIDVDGAQPKDGQRIVNFEDVSLIEHSPPHPATTEVNDA